MSRELEQVIDKVISEITTSEKIKVMKAYEDGADIEVLDTNGDWVDGYILSWNWDEYSYRVKEKITVNGDLSEPAWKKAVGISNFTQRELNFGEPATEKTVVKILYDQKNLYVGVWCYDHEPGKLTAGQLKRDFDPDTDDNFAMIIDTYGDRRNGYVFVTNPNGARLDAMIIDNGRNANVDWNGVWTVKTRKTDQGYFAEFEIPFSTLRFRINNQQTWGINFERNIRRKREQCTWQGWSRDGDLQQVNRAGVLAGISGVNKTSQIEIKPYGITGIQLNSNKKGMWNTGGDINYLITPTTKLNLTFNTDFAQVESDRTQINLTRFSLYYPEKREKPSHTNPGREWTDQTLKTPPARPQKDFRPHRTTNPLSRPSKEKCPAHQRNPCR